MLITSLVAVSKYLAKATQGKEFLLWLSVLRCNLLWLGRPVIRSMAADHIASLVRKQRNNNNAAAQFSFSHSQDPKGWYCPHPESIFWKCPEDVARGVSSRLMLSAVKLRVKINWYIQCSGCNFIKNRTFTEI